MKIVVLRILALLSAIACVSLVGTIEVLNARAGNAIGLKQRYEPHSKWRTTGPRTEWRLVERLYRAERELLPGQTLEPADIKVIEARFNQQWEKELPHYRLGLAMRNFSVWGIPLGVLTGFFSLLTRRDATRPVWTTLLTTSAVVGGLTFVVSAFRYFPSLGW